MYLLPQAVQVQLLRLLQFFCIGNSDSLHHFLTRSEYVEYCDIAAAPAPCTMGNCTRGGPIANSSKAGILSYVVSRIGAQYTLFVLQKVFKRFIYLETLTFYRCGRSQIGTTRGLTILPI